MWLIENVLYFICFLYSALACEFNEDGNAFSFTLVNPSGSEPNKMNAIAGVCAGVYCGKDFGPCFGVRGRHNLKMWGDDLSYNFDCRVFDVNLGFQSPANVAFTTKDKDSVTISELEVFKVLI